MSLANEMQIDLINLGIRELVNGSEGVELDDDISTWEEQMYDLLTEKFALVAQVKADRDHLSEIVEDVVIEPQYDPKEVAFTKKKAKKK